MANTSQTSLMKDYDSTNDTAIVDNHLLFGYQPGSDPFSISFQNNKNDLDIDTMGTGVVSKNNKNNAVATINLNQQSPCNKILSELSKENKRFAVDFRTDLEHWSGQECWVEKVPDGGGSEKAAGRAWQIIIANCNYDFLGED